MSSSKIIGVDNGLLKALFDARARFIEQSLFPQLRFGESWYANYQREFKKAGGE